MPSSGGKTCARSEEHTSELQSHDNLVCRLLLEKNKANAIASPGPPGSRPRVPYSAPGAGRGACGVRCSASRPGRARPRASEACSFFFNDTATTEIYPLSLHDALPINDTATTEIYTLSLHDVFRSRWSPYHSTNGGRRCTPLPRRWMTPTARCPRP